MRRRLRGRAVAKEADQEELATIARRNAAWRAIRQDELPEEFRGVDLATLDQVAIEKLFAEAIRSRLETLHQQLKDQAEPGNQANVTAREKERELSPVQGEIARRRADIEEVMKRLDERGARLEAKAREFERGLGKKHSAKFEEAKCAAERKDLAARQVLEDKIRDARREIIGAAAGGTPEEVRRAEIEATMAALEVRAAALKEKVARFTEAQEARSRETPTARKARRKTRGKTLL
jgi:hypothetical protein